MAIIAEWSGIEMRAFRIAARMSQADLADLLHVSERGIAKCEAGGASHVPRPVTQAMLDDLLHTADSHVHARFVDLLAMDGNPYFPPVIEPEENPVSADQYRKHPSDGKLMTAVPAGVFLAGPENEPIWEDLFWVDAHPVTNSDYARFVAATDHRPPEHWTAGRCSPEIYAHPVVQVSWTDAQAYATWADKALPTAPQWEKAARGTNGARWPWGDEMTAAKCNVRETGIGGTSKVTRFQSGVSPFYAFDMIGNVWEWTSSPGNALGSHQLKGGAWTSPLFTGDPSSFNDAAESMRDNDTGFRCAVAGAIPAAAS